MFRIVSKSALRQSVARSSVRQYSAQAKPSSAVSIELALGGIVCVAGLGYAFWSSRNGNKTESTFSKIRETFQPEKFASKYSVHTKKDGEVEEVKEEVKEEAKEEAIEETKQETKQEN